MAASKKYIINGLALLLVAILAVPLLNSCGKSGDTVIVGKNTQLIVANFSPDILPIDLYINNTLINTSGSFKYPTSPSYFNLATVGAPLQIRHNGGKKDTVFTLRTPVTQSNAKYSLFVTGLISDNTQTAVLLVDTSTISTVGRGKLRFFNGSPRSVGFDVYANGSKIFTNVGFAQSKDFTELPAGNYDVKIYNTGDLTAILKEINPLTVADGKLYTLYTYGMVGRTDSAALNAGVITNK